MRPLLFTFYLEGSLPGSNRYLDEREGPRWLERPEIAHVMSECIERGAEKQHYRIHAYVIMANHVHLLAAPKVQVPVLLQSLRTESAREANRLLGRTGHPFWHRESVRQPIRNRTELERIRAYVEWNPVKAGLVARPELYAWSSAGGASRSAVAG